MRCSLFCFLKRAVCVVFIAMLSKIFIDAVLSLLHLVFMLGHLSWQLRLRCVCVACVLHLLCVCVAFAMIVRCLRASCTLCGDDDADSAQCERFPQPGRADRWVDLSVNGFHSQATVKAAAIIALFVDCGGSAGVIRTSEEMCRLFSFMQCLLCASFSGSGIDLRLCIIHGFLMCIYCSWRFNLSSAHSNRHGIVRCRR